jgi:hypothetical protein
MSAERPYIYVYMSEEERRTIMQAAQEHKVSVSSLVRSALKTTTQDYTDWSLLAKHADFRRNGPKPKRPR